MEIINNTTKTLRDDLSVEIKEGSKLSKQNLAAALDINQAPQLLHTAILALGQAAVDLDQPQRMLAQAVAQWNRDRVPRGRVLPGIFK